MFGYVKIDKAELKTKEVQVYTALYCGLCMSLKKNFGEISRFTLNYDITFLQILLSSLYEPQDYGKMTRCLVHPIKKTAKIENAISPYAAAMNVLLSYIRDDGDKKAHIMKVLLQSAYDKAKARYPQKDEAIKVALGELHALEAENSTDIDRLSNAFGKALAPLFVYREDVFAPILTQIGYNLGKYIYIADALDDMEKDEASGSFNPFLKTVRDAGFREEQRAYLLFLLSNVEREMNRLPLLKHKGILDNILYSGIHGKIRQFIREEPQNKDKDGEIIWQ